MPERPLPTAVLSLALPTSVVSHSVHMNSSSSSILNAFAVRAMLERGSIPAGVKAEELEN
jgi:hypothetical protein